VMQYTNFTKAFFAFQIPVRFHDTCIKLILFRPISKVRPSCRRFSGKFRPAQLSVVFICVLRKVCCFPVVQQPNWGLGHLIVEVCRDTQLDTHTHTHTHTHTLGRTPLDEWSVRRRGRYLHNTQQI
jgi:hypothetical protein